MLYASNANNAINKSSDGSQMYQMLYLYETICDAQYNLKYVG